MSAVKIGLVKSELYLFCLQKELTNPFLFYILKTMTDRLIEPNPKIFAQKCPVCNGFGTLSFGKKMCHACKGKGYIVINLERQTDENKNNQD